MNNPFHPNPFHPNFFHSEPFDTKFKWDYCMRKISELEQRIYQLECEKKMRLDPILKISSILGVNKADVNTKQ